MVAHQRCGCVLHSLCKATSAASSLALSTYWPSYQKRAGTLMLPMWTLLDQAVRPPAREAVSGNVSKGKNAVWARVVVGG